ncbi:MAG: BtpA/SgcQ family protein [Phycisphaerae bacterium]
MTHASLSDWNIRGRLVIGMVHLAPLPGAPRFAGDLAAVRDAMFRDADALVSSGLPALMVENFGDVPFYPRRVPALVVAHMTELAGALRRRFDVPLGINVLRNDGESALAVASAVGAQMIRVNVLCGARVTDQGVIEGIAHDLLRARASANANDIRILADCNVKHATALGQPRAIEDELRDTIERGAADGVVISGRGTGQSTSLDDVRRAKAAAGATPVLIGSGISARTIHDYAPHADGFIVGTALKVGGVASNPVDPNRARDFMSRLADAG